MRGPQRLAAISTALLGLCVAAAWVLPPLLDWGRYRATISKIAAAELGRPVLLGGKISLSLFPELVLTASDVTIPDNGDGASAKLGALRLQLALTPLLSGRMVIRDLMLGTPVINLPWPPPGNVTRAIQPRDAHELAVRMEAGILRIGKVTLSDVAAALQLDPYTGAFSADGSVLALGHSWHFTIFLAAPGADGVSGLDAAIDGQGRAQNTGGTFRGRILASGAIQGAADLRGPDLSVIMPAPKIAWRAQGMISASGNAVEAPQLDLMLGAAPVQAALTLHLLPRARLEMSIGAGQIGLDGWAPMLAAISKPPLGAMLGVPAEIALAIEAGDMGGGTLRDIRLKMRLLPGRTVLEQASLTLPGASKFSFAGNGQDGPVRGSAIFQATDLPATAAWLHHLIPKTLPDLAGALPSQVSLTGQLQWDAAALALQTVAGDFGGTGFRGNFTAGWAQHVKMAADVTLDRLALENLWPISTAAQIRPPLLGDADVSAHVRTDGAAWHGQKLGKFSVDARKDATGLTLHGMLEGPAGGVNVSGQIGPDGIPTSFNLSASTNDASCLRQPVPTAWLPAARLLNGDARLKLSANGPLSALAFQMRADEGDLRAEAEGKLDPFSPAIDMTVTLHHPGAPRLLALLGFPGAEAWLDTGSLALLAHIQGNATHLSVPDFALTAAGLRLVGQFTADFSGQEPGLAGRVQADSLNFPVFSWPADAAVPTAWLQGWHGALHLDAASILFGRLPWAENLAADITVAGGGIAIKSLRAGLDQGALQGEADFAAGKEPPKLVLRGQITGAALPAGLGVAKMAFSGGTGDLAADVTATGHSPASWLATLTGDLRGSVQDAGLEGIDLARLTRTLQARPPRLQTLLQRQLSAASGRTDGLAGTMAGQLKNGVLVVGAARMSAQSGHIAAAGTVDLPDKTVDLQLTLWPDLPDPPTNLGLIGPWESPKRVVTAPRLPAAPNRLKARPVPAH